MRDENEYCKLLDCKVSPENIPQAYTALTPTRAMMLRDEVKIGDYISIQNQNNLSEVHIYRRAPFLNEDQKILRWDGITCDYSWFNESTEEDSVFFIANAEQLAGFANLVLNGNSFEGKTIRLTSNINLNNKEWTPIGGNYEFEHLNISGDIFYKIKNTGTMFAGTFDGDGHTIYGFRMSNIAKETKFAGFFKAVNHAVIKNIIFENALVSTNEPEAFASVVCGYAEASTFINTIVSGRVRGECCSSIACVASDTSFYDCINRASLTIKAEKPNHQLIAGGIAAQISLSNEMISKIHQNEPILFDRCIQNGEITAFVSHASKFWGGQLYGCLAHDPNGEQHAIIIDRCESTKEMVVHGLDNRETQVVFHGKEDREPFPTNYVSGIEVKTDLLNGLLGKTSSAISVKVINVTSSMVVDSMILPGSLNVLKSDSFRHSFVTIDANPIRPEDGIANLEPYFTYIKTSKI